MTALTLPTSLARLITKDSRKVVKNRDLIIQFGNGYKQVTPDGQNHIIDSWILVFAPLQGTVLTEMQNFITSAGTRRWFWWTPLGETVAKKWAILTDSLEINLLTTNIHSYVFTIEQRFDLGT